MEPSNIHLTLKFLGDTEENMLPEIKEIIDSTAGNHDAIIVPITRLGAFPNFNRPRVIWVGSTADTEDVAMIAEEIDLGTEKSGWERENKRFTPHLTLGRVKTPGGLHELTDAAQTYRFEKIEINLDRIALYQSTLTPRGPIYKKLHEAKLR